jgi:hypothetical protein
MITLQLQVLQTYSVNPCTCLVLADPIDTTAGPVIESRDKERELWSDSAQPCTH